jgi:hypothetical protein
MFDVGGWNIGVWLMIAIDVAAVVILGLAIAYGNRMSTETRDARVLPSRRAHGR